MRLHSSAVVPDAVLNTKPSPGARARPSGVCTGAVTVTVPVFPGLSVMIGGANAIGVLFVLVTVGFPILTSAWALAVLVWNLTRFDVETRVPPLAAVVRYIARDD